MLCLELQNVIMENHDSSTLKTMIFWHFRNENFNYCINTRVNENYTAILWLNVCVCVCYDFFVFLVIFDGFTHYQYTIVVVVMIYSFVNNTNF